MVEGQGQYSLPHSSWWNFISLSDPLPQYRRYLPIIIQAWQKLMRAPSPSLREILQGLAGIYRGWSHNKQAYSNEGREWTSKAILKVHCSGNWWQYLTGQYKGNPKLQITPFTMMADFDSTFLMAYPFWRKLSRWTTLTATLMANPNNGTTRNPADPIWCKPSSLGRSSTWFQCRQPYGSSILLCLENEGSQPETMWFTTTEWGFVGGWLCLLH